MSIFSMNPLTLKRWQRFRAMKRAWYSFLLLIALYVVTLSSELFCSTSPLLICIQVRWYFPLFRTYSESEFVSGGREQLADYPALARRGVFDEAFVLWTPLRSDPYRIVPVEELRDDLRQIMRLVPEVKVAGITFNEDGVISRCSGLESFMPQDAQPPKMTRRSIWEFWVKPDHAEAALAPFWAGEAAETVEVELTPAADSPFPPVKLVIAGGEARGARRRTIRARILESGNDSALNTASWEFAAAASMPLKRRDSYSALPEDIRAKADAMRRMLKDGEAPAPEQVNLRGRKCTLTIEDEAVRFPFRPVKGHWMGIDDAGRDVFARIIYGLRLALNFGAILVFFSLAGGSFFGILQGYMGGTVDIIGQRLIEIWSAMPFLYVMILMGSIYGTGFTLLLICYALFNWIGISYFMRAETLRLRRQPFVEAARCMGLSGWKIAWKHILPNALVPLVTFFPFSLVGAIGSLAALDYLGFGLPVPSPSLGELMAQGQMHRWAWWLIFFPASALFIVMMLGVMVGEGIRNAFDPRRQARMQ